MGEPRLRADLLRLVCAALPDEHFAAIAAMDPAALSTHVAARKALVQSGTALPAELNDAFHAQLDGALVS